jgi:hypothetical protein
VISRLPGDSVRVPPKSEQRLLRQESRVIGLTSSPTVGYGLPFSIRWVYFMAMSALEIIEKINALPPEEKAKVLDYVQQLQAGKAATGEVSYMAQSEFDAAKERVFSKHSELLKRLAQ